MRIADFIANRTGAYQFSGSRYSGAAQLPVSSQPSGRSGYNMPMNVGLGRSSNPGAMEGIILDVDWNRVRRFVQRFTWQAEPPESIRLIREFWETRDPILSSDGDRAELGNGNAPSNKGLIYGADGASKPDAVEPKSKCSTCESRRYVDKSDDASVSYQTPTKINPRMAALAVGAHEREHITNEKAKAGREGRDIVSQTVTINYSICPECNIMYPSGGSARTQSVKSAENGQDDSMTPEEGMGKDESAIGA